MGAQRLRLHREGSGRTRRREGLGDASDADGELYDYEAGTARSGRLINVEPTSQIDDYAYLYADDIGRDGGAASAEEAAVHIVADEDEPEPI
jgi:hypothetical protein